MKFELPCDIVKDLLPSYVDGLTSPASGDAVREHLNVCSKCNKLYCEMKSEYSSNDTAEDNGKKDSEIYDKKLFKKINRRLSKKMRITLCAAVIILILITVGWEILYNEPFKTVSPNDVAVSVENYYAKSLVNNNTDNDQEDYSVTIYSSEDDAENAADFVNISIPDFTDISLSRESFESTEYISLIKFSSSYPLRAILWDNVEENGENILVITDFRTTFISGKNDSLLESQYTIDFRKTDKVVFRDKNGTEMVLWEAGEK